MKPLVLSAALTALTALVALVALSCTTTKGITPDEARVAQAPTSTVGIAAVPPSQAIATERAAEPASPPVAREREPGERAAIGDRCRPEDALQCGTKGRVAMTVEMKNGPRPRQVDFPCEPQAIPSEGFGEHGSACVKDDRIYLASDCIECRMYSRWEMSGLVAEMSELQLVKAQKRVGLRAEPVLRTPEAWRGAIAKAASGQAVR